MTDIIEAYKSPWEETIDAYAEDNRRLREENTTLRKQIAELQQEIGFILKTLLRQSES